MTTRRSPLHLTAEEAEGTKKKKKKLLQLQEQKQQQKELLLFLIKLINLFYCKIRGKNSKEGKKTLKN